MIWFLALLSPLIKSSLASTKQEQRKVFALTFYSSLLILMRFKCLISFNSKLSADWAYQLIRVSINPQNRNQLLQLVEDNNDQTGSLEYSRSRRSRNSDRKPSYNQGPITSLGFPQTAKRSPSYPFHQSAPQPLFLPNSALSNLLLQAPNHVAPDQLILQVPGQLAPIFNSPLRTTDPGNEGIPRITPQNIPLEFAIPPHNPGWHQVTK